jgi:Flp pilus assembly protein TadB
VINSLPMALFLAAGAIALFSFLAVASWSDARRREREAYYKGEALKKLSETQGAGAPSVLQYLHEEERNAMRQRQEGHRLGGLITLGVGIGMGVFLRAMVHDEPAYLAGLILVLVGVALLVYSYILAPKE